MNHRVRMHGNWFRSATVGLCAAALVMGCETKAQTGALVGALGGAAIGGAIGSHSHARAGEGAAIGAAAGAVGGLLVGHAMDKADEKKARARDRYEYNDRSGSAYGYRSTPTGATGAMSRRDVMEWSDRGVSDEVIIDRIERSGQVFRLTAAEQNELRDAGVSERVIRAMKNTARR